MIHNFKTILFAVFLSLNTQAQSLIDQFDTTYNAGLSARTLPGYSWYQTFTAGLTGNMTGIEIGFFNYISGVGTLEIYDGLGITGNLIYTSQVNVNCPAGNCNISYPVNCNVQLGNTYTVHFVPGNGMPDPYGVQQDFTNSYPSGEMFLIDPSGTYPFNMDLIFKTYVNTMKTYLQEYVDLNLNDLYRINGSSIKLSENVNGKLYSMEGQEVNFFNLNIGMYCLKIVFNNRITCHKILIN